MVTAREKGGWGEENEGKEGQIVAERDFAVGGGGTIEDADNVL